MNKHIPYNIVFIGWHNVPVPPGDIATGVTEHIYQISHYLGELGCRVWVITIKGGEIQREKRQKSAANFCEIWHSPFPQKLNIPFLQKYFNYLLYLLNNFLFSLSSSLSLMKLMRREHIDVIQVHTGSPTLAIIIVNKLMRNHAVIIFRSHSPIYMTKPNGFWKLINFEEIVPLKWVDHIIVDTPTIRRFLVSDFKIDSAKITPMIVGITLDEDEVNQFLSNRVVCHKSNIVLCIGNVTGRKNQFSIVRAIPKVIAFHPEVKFVFAGPFVDPDYYHSIQDFIAENKLSYYVEFKGWVTRQELYNLYNDSKLFLFPSVAESQGVVMLEAMTFGLPVIASNLGPIVDVVNQNEGSAILVDPFDIEGIASAVIRVLDDSSLWQSLSQKGEELAHGFSSKLNATQLLSLYKQLVQNKTR